MTKYTERVLAFIQSFNDAPPKELEEILEWLADRGMLSKKGKAFWRELWGLFVRERKEEK